MEHAPQITETKNQGLYAVSELLSRAARKLNKSTSVLTKEIESIIGSSLPKRSVYQWMSPTFILLPAEDLLEVVAKVFEVKLVDLKKARNKVLSAKIIRNVQHSAILNNLNKKR